VSTEGKEELVPARQRADELQHEIEVIRDDLAGMVGELDRRRHELFDVRRHAVPLILVSAALLAIATGGITLAVARRRHRARLGPRLGRLREAVERMIDKPKRVANNPGVGRKIVGAGGAAAASVLAKHLAKRLVAQGRAEHPA
jgi:hypothetical protein